MLRVPRGRRARHAESKGTTEHGASTSLLRVPPDTLGPLQASSREARETGSCTLNGSQPKLWGKHQGPSVPLRGKGGPETMRAVSRGVRFPSHWVSLRHRTYLDGITQAPVIYVSYVRTAVQQRIR
ncbi:hypothetical protein QBC32DRAFT_350677 [Pseudoneurospora amorphoporcata]|uniref:Uncharacterized protein n=1 Tax=Pseudoneurospora amorphoporcata TaxID=241081 RepID=A0AAN6NRB4_9PEZI|nr:hypothetical protein QBC32DRAFT_350677 [Pseudoneurospora amorphoporcata]